MQEKITIFDVTGRLVINHKAREWCKLPYPRHSEGCLNYGNSPDCPPEAPLIEDWLDFNKPHWFIVTKFDLATHMKHMKEEHPDFTVAQCRNVIWWQNTPKKELRDAIGQFTKEHPDTIFTDRPEAMGVNVMTTARRVGVPIKTKPIDTVYKIALVGYPKNGEKNRTQRSVGEYI